MLDSIIGWVNDNNGVLTLLFACVVAVSTVAYAILTARLVRETVAIREIESNPDVAVYVLPRGANSFIFDMYIHNVGRGPALDVTFDFTNRDFGDRLWIGEMTLFDGLSFLAPGAQISFPVGTALELIGDTFAVATSITVNCRSTHGSLHSRRFDINFGMFRGMMIVDDTGRSGKMIADELKKINASLSRIIKVEPGFRGALVVRPYLDLQPSPDEAVAMSNSTTTLSDRLRLRRVVDKINQLLHTVT